MFEAVAPDVVSAIMVSTTSATVTAAREIALRLLPSTPTGVCLTLFTDEAFLGIHNGFAHCGNPLLRWGMGAVGRFIRSALMYVSPLLYSYWQHRSLRRELALAHLPCLPAFQPSIHSLPYLRQRAIMRRCANWHDFMSSPSIRFRSPRNHYAITSLNNRFEHLRLIAAFVSTLAIMCASEPWLTKICRKFVMSSSLCTELSAT